MFNSKAQKQLAVGESNWAGKATEILNSKTHLSCHLRGGFRGLKEDIHG